MKERVKRNSKLPTLYWLPKLHKRPNKSRFIANSSTCTTTELSIEACIWGSRDTGYLPFYFQGYRILSSLLPGIWDTMFNFRDIPIFLL